MLNLYRNPSLVCFIAPTTSKLWILVPLFYTLILQVLTGIPKPDAMIQFSTNEMLVRFAEELFDYPYWLQDLSHLPLFFGYSWSWHWYFLRKNQTKKGLKLALLLSFTYAILNEILQVFIPQRFPSIGDITMNLAGVFLAAITHRLGFKNLHSRI